MPELAQLHGPTSLDRAGGKWVGLCRLHAEGARVPSAFCIEAEHFRERIVRAGLRDDIAALDECDAGELPSRAEALRGRIRGGAIPDALSAEILRAAQEMGGGRVAVRSSATAEDLAEASFAGQYDSFLNVEGDVALLDAVTACWASAFSERSIVSRQRLGMGQDAVAMAVVVQEMVDAEVSGVAFTRHPLEGRPVILVEACPGLGEALVSGRVDPDRFEIDREGCDWRQLSGKVEASLDGSRLLAMRDEFLRLEERLGFPADLEWSWKGEQLFLLQGRPISAALPATGAAQAAGRGLLRGTPASPGIAEGRARVLLDANEGELESGEVLVTAFTDPAWTRHFVHASALVMEHGGMLCHGAILARECGIPAVVGIADVTRRISDKTSLRVDGGAGSVESV